MTRLSATFDLDVPVLRPSAAALRAASSSIRVCQGRSPLIVLIGGAPLCVMPVIALSPTGIFVGRPPEKIAHIGGPFRVTLTTRAGEHVIAHGQWGEHDDALMATEIRLCELVPETRAAISELAASLLERGEALPLNVRTVA